MEYNEIIIRLFESALAGAVGIVATSYYKDFKAKKSDRTFLFMRMVAAKSYIRITQDAIRDMNLIPILFRGQKKVIKAYDSYMKAISPHTGLANEEMQSGLYVDLLREIGNVTGYKGLDNKTLLHRYLPTASFDDYQSSKDFYEARLRYYRNSADMAQAFLDGKNGSQENGEYPSDGEPKQ